MRPGSIIRVFCHFCKPPKIKYYVLVAAEPYAIGFLINSNPTPLQSIRDDLCADLVKVKKVDHPNFLDDDSLLDCTEPIEDYELHTLQARCKVGGNFLGTMTIETAYAIKSVVSDSMNISPSMKKIILKNLVSEYPDEER